MQFAASAEKYTTHILAEAVCAQAERDGVRLLRVKNLVELDGQGAYIMRVRGVRERAHTCVYVLSSRQCALRPSAMV